MLFPPGILTLETLPARVSISHRRLVIMANMIMAPMALRAAFRRFSELTQRQSRMLTNEEPHRRPIDRNHQSTSDRMYIF